MSIGDKWNELMGSMDKLLDAYYDMGGNFIDTANNYQDGTCKEFIGEWMEKREIRDQIVFATKVYWSLLERSSIWVSDTPAWIVAQANQYERDHGKTPFVIYQGRWNIMDRSFERDIIPMARSLGLAVAPWSVLASGKLRTDAEEERRRATGENGRPSMTSCQWERTEDEIKMSRALEKVAKEVGAKSIAAVAIAH